MIPALLAVLITSGAPSADDAVVALVRGDVLVCTGTVIAPHAVLTAAHCLSGDELPSAVLGASVAGATVRLAPVAGFVHPQFDRATLAHDVAVLIFAEPFTVTPPPLATDTGTSVGAPVRVVGYGWTVAGDTAPAVRRTGTSRVTAIDADGISTVASPSQTCDGDSGGPALATIAGTERIVGVASSGDTACATGARHARVDSAASDGNTLSNASFLAARLGATADHAAAAGARCWYASNCAVGACTPALDDPRLSFCAPACGGSAGACPANLACTDELCRPPLPSPGAAGSPCASASECIDGVCLSPGAASSASALASTPAHDIVAAADTATVCTRRCFTDIPGFTCPAPLACAPAADGMDACFLPAPRTDDGGCRIGGGSTGAAATFGAFAALMMASRRRRRVRLRR